MVYVILVYTTTTSCSSSNSSVVVVTSICEYDMEYMMIEVNHDYIVSILLPLCVSTSLTNH